MDAGVAVGCIAHEREQIRNEWRIDAELFADPSRIANRFAPAVDLHHARISHALRQILVGRPDGDFLDLLVLRSDMRSRSERIISFELDHRPDDNAHLRECLLERMELREKRGLDAGAGLVVRPKPIAKRLDHMIGRDTKVNAVVLQHLKNGLQHADDRAVRTVFAFVEPAQAVEVTEEFVGPVYKMYDHFGPMLDLVAAPAKRAELCSKT